jgi:hypothetical protein
VKCATRPMRWWWSVINIEFTQGDTRKLAERRAG